MEGKPKFIENVRCPKCGEVGVAMTLPGSDSVTWGACGHLTVRSYKEKYILVHDFRNQVCEGEDK